jgi:hypothetical protein
MPLSHPPALLTAAVTWLVSFGPAPAAAQAFDISRAALNDSTVFAPFVVTGSVPLRDAVAAGAVDADTHVLVFEAGGARLALVTAQMAYHHVAQGDIAGEPWMVSF